MQGFRRRGWEWHLGYGLWKRLHYDLTISKSYQCIECIREVFSNVKQRLEIFKQVCLDVFFYQFIGFLCL